MRTWWLWWPKFTVTSVTEKLALTNFAVMMSRRSEVKCIVSFFKNSIVIDSLLFILLLTVFILLQRLNRVMKSISSWVSTFCYRPAGLWPRQSDCRGVLHRQMSSGWYEEHLREYKTSAPALKMILYIHQRLFTLIKLNILQKTELLSFFFFCLCAGISGRGDHQRHVRGRQHVHLLPVWQEGPRREKVRRELDSVCKIIFNPVW